MRKNDCLFERASHVAIGLILLLFAAGLSLIGITVLPVLGVIAALPVVFLAALFFNAPRSRECTLS